MSITVVKLGDHKAVFLGHKLVHSFSPSDAGSDLDKVAAFKTIDVVAQSLSVALDAPVRDVYATENPNSCWTWEEIAKRYIDETRDAITITIPFATFDENACSLESIPYSITSSSIADIIDHSSQLICVAHAMSTGKCNGEDFVNHLIELESALTVSGIVEEQYEPISITVTTPS